MTTANQPLRTRTFVWTVDTKNDGGKTGWKPVDAPDNFYPGPSFLTAHDTVEHLNNSPDWAHELIAFGVTAYGRMHSSAEMMKVIVEDFVGFSGQHDWEYPTPKEAWRKPLPGKEELFLTEFKSLCHSYIKYRNNDLIALLEGRAPLIPPSGLDTRIDNALAWFRRGWRLAKRLNHGNSPKKIWEMQCDLIDAIDAEDARKKPKPGDKLTISLNRKDCTFALKREDKQVHTMRRHFEAVEA